jgi:hypothetical protein
MTKTLLISTLMMFAVACTPSKRDETPPPETPPSSEAPPAAPAAVNPVEANRWCRVEDWESFQVVMRMTVQGPQVITEYLKLNDDGFEVYQYTQKMTWEMKGDLASVPNKYSITLHQVATDIITLPGFDEQKRIYTEILSRREKLQVPSPDFTPTIAMTTHTRSVETGYELERNVYPCSTYSALFEGEGPQKPLIDLILLFASNSKGYTEQGKDHLARLMPISFPVVELAAGTNVANTQWCAWKEVAPNELLLKTMTIGTDQFVENIHSQVFASMEDEDAEAYLKENALRSEFYQMNFSGNWMTGKNLTPASRIPKHPINELFTMVQDANGMKALVRMDAVEPDRSWPVYADIYFDCQDVRPSQVSPSFALKLPEILSLQSQILANPPPPQTSSPAL